MIGKDFEMKKGMETLEAFSTLKSTDICSHSPHILLHINLSMATTTVDIWLLMYLNIINLKELMTMNTFGQSVHENLMLYTDTSYGDIQVHHHVEWICIDTKPIY